MSQLEVDKIIPQSGTTLTIGDSGDTVNFADGTNLSIDTNTLYIDSTNNRVGIANASPSVALDVTGAAKVSGDLTVDTNTLYVDSTNNRVGMGTTSPSRDLQVIDKGDGNAVISVKTSNDTYSSVFFGDTSADNIGKLLYDHTNDSLQTVVNNSERMRIDSSGNLLVGQTTNAITGLGIGLVPNGISHFYTSGGRALELGRGTSDGEILRFNRSGTTVGSIGVVNSNNLFIQGDSTNSGLQCGTNTILPVQSGANASNTIDMGDASNLWKDIYLGGGLYVGGTGSANKLDDYEEGLHTVTCTDNGGGATITMNTSFDQLAYTKIGRVVNLSGTLLFSSISGSFTGALSISIPFTVGNFADSSGRTTISVGVYNVDFTTGTYAFLDAGEGNNFLTLRTGGDNINTGQGRPNSSAQIYIGGSYITDA